MGISRAFLPSLVNYLELTRGVATMAVIGDQDVRCSPTDLHSVRADVPRYRRWRRSSGDSDLLDVKSLLKEFGVREAVTIDLFGDPDVVIDLSVPLDEDYRSRFDAVLEIGTIEHIIDPLQALKNIDAMLRKGGTVVHLSPIKERPNHGYYSLSPQLLHDFYLSDGGYELLRCEILSFFRGYDSFLSPMIVRDFVMADELANHRTLGYVRAIRRNAGRLSVRLSKGTYIGFVARKQRVVSRGTLVQQRFATES